MLIYRWRRVGDGRCIQVGAETLEEAERLVRQGLPAADATALRRTSRRGASATYELGARIPEQASLTVVRDRRGRVRRIG